MFRPREIDHVAALPHLVNGRTLPLQTFVHYAVDPIKFIYMEFAVELLSARYTSLIRGARNMTRGMVYAYMNAWVTHTCGKVDIERWVVYFYTVPAERRGKQDFFFVLDTHEGNIYKRLDPDRRGRYNLNIWVDIVVFVVGNFVYGGKVGYANL